MNRNLLRIGLAVATAGAVVTTTVVAAQGDPSSQSHDNRMSTRLSGYSETPLALSSPGSGSFDAKINEADGEITYSLTYGGLPTSVAQAHIHFGSRSQSGGVSAFLCTNLGNGPAGTPTCPTEGTVTGTITPAGVVGPAGQGIAAGEFDELVAALRAGSTYVNVHTQQFPGGELRGQLR